MSSAPSVLGVFAHPDDEALAAGGLLARAAAAGARTAVVTATWAPGTRRTSELAEALRVLGAGEPRLLGFADERVTDSAPGASRLVDAPLDDAVRRLVAHVRDVRPEIVVTHDADGGLTGHPDHVITHRLATLAVIAAGREEGPDTGTPWRPRQIWAATHPTSTLPTLRELAGTRRALHTTTDSDIDLSLDVSPWLDQKVAAIAAHRHEVERGALPGVVVGLDRSDQVRLLGTESYVVRELRSGGHHPGRGAPSLSPLP